MGALMVTNDIHSQFLKLSKQVKSWFRPFETPGCVGALLRRHVLQQPQYISGPSYMNLDLWGLISRA